MNNLNLSNSNIEKIEELVDELMEEYKNEPLKILNVDDEYEYLAIHKKRFVKSLYDITNYFRVSDRSSLHILEIGCYLGITSIALSRMGFTVTASDVTEFISCKSLQDKFVKNGVSYKAVNLRDYKLPFDDKKYDAVIMCEVLEHLNFNPLPVIKEINRIIKPEGLLYLTVPNLASLKQRRKLLQGQSIHNPIDHFFSNLSPNSHDFVGLHWREYTIDEIKEMLEKMEFTVVKQQFVSCENKNAPKAKLSTRKKIKQIIYSILNLKPIKRVVLGCLFDPDIDHSLNSTQLTYALKRKDCDQHFHFTDATLPENSKRRPVMKEPIHYDGEANALKRVG